MVSRAGCLVDAGSVESLLEIADSSLLLLIRGVVAELDVGEVGVWLPSNSAYLPTLTKESSLAPSSVFSMSVMEDKGTGYAFSFRC